MTFNGESPANSMLFALAAVVVAHVAAMAFFPALCLRGPFRTLSWLLCSAFVALSPCLVPLGYPAWRFVSTLVAIGLLAKLYDLFRSGDLAFRRGIQFYIAWLPNAFWLVLRRNPPPNAQAVMIGTVFRWQPFDPPLVWLCLRESLRLIGRTCLLSWSTVSK